jgi:uncharacterized membrane-anchored protein YitT (DUF2179 family)
MRKRLIRESQNALFILLSILCASMGLRGFLLSSNFIDGGVTGVSMLLGKLTIIPLPFWLPVVNLPFIALGYRYLGRAFAIRSVLAITGLAISVAFVPYPNITPDLLLTAVFGGFFLGAGVGFAVRGGAVLDGTEIAALLISKRVPLLKVGDIILAFNIVLFLVAMTVLGVQAALYSILTYVAAAKTLDFVIYGIEQYTAFMIISLDSAKIRDALIAELGRGVTVLRGYGAMSRVEMDVLYCVVTRLEIGKVRTVIDGIDPNALVAYHPLAHAEGGRTQRNSQHEHALAEKREEDRVKDAAESHPE